MGAFLTVVLGVPAVAAVGWRLLRPTREAIEAAAATAQPAEGEPRKPDGRPRRRGGDAYAEAVNFSVDADNGVRVHHDTYDDEAA
jgi:hypothetical protein